LPLIGISARPGELGFKLHFDKGATKKQIDTIEDVCHKHPELFGGWEPLELPNLDKFEQVVLADPTLPFATKFAVPSFVGMLRPFSKHAASPAIRALWEQALVESKEAGWLHGKAGDGKSITSKIEKHAHNCNLNLAKS
jgi:hypothetical protein